MESWNNRWVSNQRGHLRDPEHAPASRLSDSRLIWFPIPAMQERPLESPYGPSGSGTAGTAQNRRDVAPARWAHTA